jgi:hypothetical protein
VRAQRRAHRPPVPRSLGASDPNRSCPADLARVSGAECASRSPVLDVDILDTSVGTSLTDVRKENGWVGVEDQWKSGDG